MFREVGRGGEANQGNLEGAAKRGCHPGSFMEEEGVVLCWVLMGQKEGVKTDYRVPEE